MQDGLAGDRLAAGDDVGGGPTGLKRCSTSILLPGLARSAVVPRMWGAYFGRGEKVIQTTSDVQPTWDSALPPAPSLPLSRSNMTVRRYRRGVLRAETADKNFFEEPLIAGATALDGGLLMGPQGTYLGRCSPYGALTPRTLQLHLATFWPMAIPSLPE